MEIKIYTIKLSPPRWVRNLVVYVALPIGALLGAAVGVKAGVNLAAPFVKGQPIVAADVNANFAALNAALPVVTEWQAWNPVLRTADSPPQPVTQQSSKGMWRRVGDSIEINIETTFSGTPTTTNWWIWELPNSLKYDSSKIANTHGLGRAYSASLTTNILLDVFPRGANGVSAVGQQNSNFVSAGAPFAIQNGDAVGISATLPVQGWTVTR